MNKDVSDLCCVNSQCPDYGKRGTGNLYWRKGYGKDERRFVRCRTCKTEFSERKGTAMFRVHLPAEKVVAILKHVGDGCGIRPTGRLLDVSKDTVMSILKRAGQHAENVHNERARDLEVNEVQFDEKWSFVGKKRRPVRPGQSGG
jgi:transposase-like protein